MRTYHCALHKVTLEIDDASRTYRYTHGPGRVQATCHLLREPEPQAGPHAHEHRGVGGKVIREICTITGG